MRILVCDDDAAFAGQLAGKDRGHRKAAKNAALRGELRHRCSAVACFAAGKIRSGFLDIDMGPLNGVDLAVACMSCAPICC